MQLMLRKPLKPYSSGKDSRQYDAHDCPPDMSQLTAHSAASSLALLRFLPSYQYRAANVWPWMVTLLDQAVRPPNESSVSRRYLLACSRITYLVGQKRFGKRGPLFERRGKTLYQSVSVVLSTTSLIYLPASPATSCCSLHLNRSSCTKAKATLCTAACAKRQRRRAPGI